MSTASIALTARRAAALVNAPCRKTETALARNDMALLQMENAVSVPDASGLGLSCKVSLPGLERFF